MAKVFVTGGNGLIGQSVAAALRRRGYSVSALIRNESQSDELLKLEITPVVGTFENLSSYRHAIEEASVVVDTVMLFEGTDPLGPNKQILKLLAELSKKYSQKRRYVYTSGILVYGDSPDVVDETVPPKQKFLQHRILFEQEVVTNQDAEGVVIRPSYVYGGKGGASAPFVFGHQGRPVVVGDPDRQTPWVHADDLADAYVRVVEAAGSIVKGQIYNIGGELISERDAFVAAARAAGATGEVEYKAPTDNFFDQIRTVRIKLSDQKIRTQLGWQPRITGFVQNVDKYYKAYLAYKKK